MVPSAFRRRDSTITILVNEVRVIRIAGAKDKTVNKRKICKTTPTCPGLSALSRARLRCGRLPGTAPQHAGFDTQVNTTKRDVAMIRGFNCLPIFSPVRP